MTLVDISRDEMQVYSCRKIARPLSLSGRLDDPLWKQAPEVFLVDTVTGQAPRQRTVVRLLYDDLRLYVGFTCEDDYVWGTMTERDSMIYREECVEVFLCPSGALRQYYEINVSPLNTVFDAIVLNGRISQHHERKFATLETYHCDGLATKVFVDGEIGVKGARGWSAEYAIPFTSVIGHANIFPESGDEWRMNLYRIDAQTSIEDQILTAWSPTGDRDFHVPWRFGRLVFE